MHRLRTEPWAYEYKIPLPQQETPVATERSAAVMFLVALLKALIGVPETEEMEKEGKGTAILNI